MLFHADPLFPCAESNDTRYCANHKTKHNGVLFRRAIFFHFLFLPIVLCMYNTTSNQGHSFSFWNHYSPFMHKYWSTFFFLLNLVIKIPTQPSKIKDLFLLKTQCICSEILWLIFNCLTLLFRPDSLSQAVWSKIGRQEQRTLWLPLVWGSICSLSGRSHCVRRKD